MPEGDTILRAARTLGKILTTDIITGFETTVPALARVDLAGRRVEQVSAQGKWLLVRFDDGSTLATHMRMSGSWHAYRPGERWLIAPRHARVVLRTERAVAVCFRAPVVELLRPVDAARHPALSRLGPDVLAPELDEAEIVRRLRERADLSIAEALLDQTAVAGIGNIYKSETLFARGLDPFAPVPSVTDAELGELARTARRLMASNLVGAMRTTTTTRGPGGPRFAVYHRGGEPCPSCGTPIQRRVHGRDARSTFWCASCQPPRAPPPE